MFKHHHLGRAALLFATLSLAACLGGRSAKPGDTLANAEQAVARAEQARVGDYDAADLRAARENLAAARAAANDPAQAPQVRWLAARAKADAELGIARAERSRLLALTTALQRELDDRAASPTPATTP